MSLHFLIDGYNLIKRNPALGAKRLEDGRQGLISYIERNQLQGSVRNDVTIVFDGQPGMFGLPSVSHVRVIFTEYESADDLIKTYVQESKNRKLLVVVTDDKQLMLYVRALGAGILSGAEFLKRNSTSQGKSKSANKHLSASKVITASFEHLVNQEFEQLWVLKNNKKNKSEK